ncbi:MAG TPA: translocase [Candidatus Eisenbacteria bacterium]|nr:translocase [Candidatus Eisenbacteria bacterium]
MTADRKPSAVDRALRIFTDVRPGESGTALLLTLNVFLLLTAYYVIKPVREALILSGGGAEVKSYAAAGQALLLLGAVPLYSSLAGRLPRRRLINIVTLFFTGCLVAFYLLAQLKLPLGVVFFLWVGIFNLMVVAQFWSFANDVYTTDEGKRLFPIVAFGASAGAVLGSYMTGQLIGPLGVYQLLLVAAGLLVAGLVVTNSVDARERRRTEAARGLEESTAALPAATKEVRLESGEFKLADLRKELESSKPGAAPPPALTPAPAPAPSDGRLAAGGNAFKLVLGNRYLLLIALLMLFLNWVNTTGEYILGRTVAKAAADAVAAGTAGGLDEKAFIGKFYSDFFSVVNLAGLLLQLFAVSRILKFAGVRVAILVLPAIALVGYGILAFVPILAAVRWAKTAENATDYSLQNTVRNVLFLPTTREEKYKAKQAIDSFFVRAGDVLSAGLVFVGTSLLPLQTQQFAVVNLALVVVWLALAVMIGREYKRVSAEAAATAATATAATTAGATTA